MPGTSSRSRSKLVTQPEAGPSQARVDKTKSKPQKEYQPCMYFNTSRGCYNGDSCRFLHDGPEPPAEVSKICRFYAKGYCYHGSKCWYKHVAPVQIEDASAAVESAQSETSAPAEEITCGICFEVPVQFGLLNGCSHPFCLNCLRDWRKSHKKDIHLVFSNIIKTCPLCRAESRYFEKSSPKKRFCPYGYDCFYKHEDPSTGVKHDFDHGVEEMMLKFKEDLQRAARRHQLRHTIRSLHAYLSPLDIDFDWMNHLDSASDGPDPLDAFADLHIIDEENADLEPSSGRPASSVEDDDEDDPLGYWPTPGDLEAIWDV